MTIATEVRKSDLYEGNGSTVEFAFPFRVFATDQITVYRKTSDYAEEVVTDTEFTVELNADQETSPGGTVTFLTAPPAGTSVRILSSVDYLQGAELQNQGAFYPATLNDVHDKLTILCQQLKEEVDRCVIVPATGAYTREELLNQLLEVASKANEYAQLAQKTYEEVLATQKQVEEAKTVSTESAERSQASAESAAESAAQVAEDRQAAQQLFEETTELATDAASKLDSAIEASKAAEEAKDAAIAAANSSGFSYRYYETCSAGNTYPLSLLAPATNARPGDHVVNANGDLFEVSEVNETTFSVGEKLTSLKGAKGDKGDSLTVTDAFSSESDLNAAYPEGAEGGMLVNGSIYYWSETTHEWLTQGAIQGPAGEKGEPGLSANEILMNPDPVAYFNEIYGTTSAVTGDLVIDVSGTDPELVKQFEDSLE